MLVEARRRTSGATGRPRQLYRGAEASIGTDFRSHIAVLGVRGGGESAMRLPQSDWRGIRKREMVENDSSVAEGEVDGGPVTEADRSVLVEIESSGT